MIKQCFIGITTCVLGACASFTSVPETSAAAVLTDGNYQLDAKHAALLFRVSHFGVSSYTGRFTDISATLNFDEAVPQDTQLTASVDVVSLQVTPASFVKTLIGPQWLDAERYPQARFTLDGLTVTGDNNAVAAGQLSLHGVTNPVTFDVRFTGGARNPASQKYAIGFEASASFKRSDFGIDRLLSVAGDKFDFDTVRLEFNGEFVKS